MDSYRVKPNLSYLKLADIINKLYFHNLNLDKNSVRYYCKKLEENYTDLLKIESKNRDTIRDFWKSVFSVNSKEIFVE